jgi:uncharacterized protein involved in response to NO
MQSAVEARWRWRGLLAAPHRLAFFAAGVLFASIAVWWCAQLWMQHLQLAVPWYVLPATAHAILMTLGFMPLFMVGFLFTAGPKWLGMPPENAAGLLHYVWSTVAGWLVFMLGCHVSALLAALGVVLVLLAWAGMAWRFARLWYRSRVDDKVHATVVLGACVLGWIAMVVVAAGLLGGQQTVARAANFAALWMFVAVVFAAVSHRMIPFFSAAAIESLDTWRPMWLLTMLVGVLLLEGVFAVVDVLWQEPAVAWRWVQVGFELPVALLLLWLAVRWGLLRSLKIRMLAMLLGGFVWLGVAFGMQALSHAMMAWTQHQQSLGLAPLHAFAMGYLGATLFAMVTRVSCGHGGRTLVADNTAWAMYWLLQTAVVLRIASALLPGFAGMLLLLAVTVWTVVAVGWAVRYGRWFGRPRLDGRPG